MSKVLVVASAPGWVDQIETRLRAEGYEVAHACSGEEAMGRLNDPLPNLVLLEWHLPRMSGAAVCRAMRSDVRLLDIPILVIGADACPNERMIAEELGVDDYIAQPFDLDELVRHVRTQVRYCAHERYCPLAGLPTGTAVVAAISRAVTAVPPRIIIYVTIEHFNTYTETYSLLEGNDLIQRAATALRQALANTAPDAFLGCTGGGEFIIVTQPQRARGIIQDAAARFKQAVAHGSFYSNQDYQQGYIVARDPRGQSYCCPLVALSFDIVNDSSTVSSARPAPVPAPLLSPSGHRAVDCPASTIGTG